MRAVPAVRRRVAREVRRHVRRFPEPRRTPGANLVLLYHRVAPLAAPDPLGMTVTPEHFIAHLDAVRSAFDVVPLSEVRRAGSRPRVAITFDDGYADNAETAAPALRERDLPASFFVTTASWGQDREFWWDRLEHLLDATAGGTADVRLGGTVLRVRLDTDAERRAARKTIGRAMGLQHPAVVERALQDLAARPGAPVPADCDTHRRMTPEQVLALSDDPLFTIGSHTCSHACLRALSPAESLHELTDSRRRLAQVLGEPPDVVAFPYGAVGTLRRAHLRQAREAGYTGALLNVPGAAERSTAMAVPRLTVGDGDAESLMSAVHRWQRTA